MVSEINAMLPGSIIRSPTVERQIKPTTNLPYTGTTVSMKYKQPALQAAFQHKHEHGSSVAVSYEVQENGAEFLQYEYKLT